MVKLVYTYGSGPYGETRGGSTPLCGTKSIVNFQLRIRNGCCYNKSTSSRSSQGGHGTGLKNLGCWFDSNLRHTINYEFEISNYELIFLTNCGHSIVVTMRPCQGRVTGSNPVARSKSDRNNQKMTISNNQKSLLRSISKFSLIVLIAITATRIWAIGLFYLFGKNSQIVERIINDSWHHYQIGLLLILIALLLQKFRKSITVAVGLGIFLEEWPVFLNDLGMNTNSLYHTKIDFVGVVSLVGLLYILCKTLYSKTILKDV